MLKYFFSLLFTFCAVPLHAQESDPSAGIYNTFHPGYYKGYATEGTVAFGTDIGWKYSPEKGLFSFDIYAGIGYTPEHLYTYCNGTATTDDDGTTGIPYFRFGFCMGVQFGKRRNLQFRLFAGKM